MTEAKGTAVATQPATQGGTGVAVYDYGQYAGAGYEGTTAADFKPSFLRVLSGSSPELETVKGARPGLIIDSITHDLYDSVLMVPAVRQHVMVAWKPRTAEGGGGGDSFGGIFELNSPEVKAALQGFKKFERGPDGKIIVPKLAGGEFDLIETVYFHGVQLLPEGGIVPVTVSFYSTGLTPAEMWLSTMHRQTFPNSVTPLPLFAHVSKLSVEKSEKGSFKWYNFAPSWANGTAADSRLSPDSDLFRAAASIYDAYKAGRTNIDYAQGGGGDAGGEKAKSASADVPF